MNKFRIAILGCGTVGGGVAKILLDNAELLQTRSGSTLELVKILDLFPLASSRRHGINRALFCGTTDELTQADAHHHTAEILSDPSIDLVVETIGGSSDVILKLALGVLDSGKHLVTANKALLAKHFSSILTKAANSQKTVGFEAAVCGAIPVIKGINEGLSGDSVESLAGIMNGTSNYILSRMATERLSFADALRGAQEKGYAEADPSLDINGGDAGHKLLILLKLLFGIDAAIGDFPVSGIEAVTSEDITFAGEIGCTLKLICFALKEGSDVFATVRPMMVRNENILSGIHKATNAVKLKGMYSQENVFIGQGAGSLETGSAIVSDIVFIARYGNSALRSYPSKGLRLASYENICLPYTITFETEDVPGITGIVTTAIGNEKINIDTVSHNLREAGLEGALFSIATKPCTEAQIRRAIAAIKKVSPEILVKEPKIFPILQ